MNSALNKLINNIMTILMGDSTLVMGFNLIMACQLVNNGIRNHKQDNNEHNEQMSSLFMRLL